MAHHATLFGCAVLGGALALGCGGIAVLDDTVGSSGGHDGAGGHDGGGGGAGGIVASTTQSSSQTGMMDPCSLPVGAACDPLAFPECEAQPVAGIPCCHVARSCLPSGVGWATAFCTDDCAQSCELVTDPDQCEALPWCLLGPDGCASPPPPP